MLGIAGLPILLAFAVITGQRAGHDVDNNVAIDSVLKAQSTPSQVSASDGSAPPIDQLSLTAIKGSTRAAIFQPVRPVKLGVDRRVSDLVLSPSRPLDDEQFNMLKALLVRRDSYLFPSSLGKSCAFIPEIVVELSGDNGSIWVLISKSCLLLAAVNLDQDWARVKMANLQKSFIDSVDATLHQR